MATPSSAPTPRRPSRNPWIGRVGGVLALLLVLVLAHQLRVADVRSDPVMAAEDPYSHMAMVREHLRDGSLDPQNTRGALYPPGLHGLAAAIWIYSGVDLYQLMIYTPVLFGMLGVAGIGILLWRYEGPLAGFVGALAAASMPELVFRAGMMSPTALDLALIPFLGWSLLEVAAGRWRWMAAAIPLCLFFVAAHPWLLAILVLTGGAFLVLYIAFPWRATRGAPVTREGAAMAVAVLGGTFGLALASRWSASGTGFSELTLPLVGNNLGVLGIAAVAGAACVTFIMLALPLFIRQRLPRLNRRALPTALQALGVLGMALLLAAITVPALLRGSMPVHVNLPAMLGWPALALAAAGFILLPISGSPAKHLGVALMLATFPFTIYNPLNSPFWPHRTVVFFGIAAAILAGVTAQHAAEGWAHVTRRLPRARPRAISLVRASRAPLLATILVATTVSAAILVETPEPYPGGWYRMFNPQEFEVLRGVADRANEDLRALVVTSSWQSQLVIAAFTEDVRRVWFKQDLFTAGSDVDGFVTGQLRRPAMYVVVDRYLYQEAQNVDTSFLTAPQEDRSWTLVAQCCAGQASDLPRVLVYQLKTSR